MKNISTYWTDDYEGFENKGTREDLLGEAHEALTRFYQKENKRSKTVKQKKQCWQ